jgi:putative alpha-1,2-mannosidase
MPQGLQDTPKLSAPSRLPGIYNSNLLGSDCRMSLCKGFTQGGSNADIVLADSYSKNITNGIDWGTGYEAMVSDAEGEVSETGLRLIKLIT